MRVFLTGATGLVGSHVAACLRARGDAVVCLRRPGADVRFLDSLGCELVDGDVRDGADDLAAGMATCDGVVHAAALVYAGRAWPEIRSVNVVGTENVLRGAARAGVGRAVHVSSVAVYGPVAAGSPVDEDASLEAPLPPGDLYARSKREAESVALKVAREEDLDVTVVRPAAVYGERDRLLGPRMAALTRLPLVPLLGPGTNTLSVVYAGNVASAVALALDRGQPGRAYNLATDHPLTQEGLARGLGEALGRRVRTVRVPAAAVRAVARAARRFGARVPGVASLPVERVACLALSDNPYSTSRIRDELGWQPSFTHEEGLRRTAAWLREGGS
ncbi:MAG TPA: NAD-dependent epimerase/dehydratase family protein [Longimicrobiales bacterium]